MFAAGSEVPEFQFDFNLQSDIQVAREFFISFFKQNYDVLFEHPPEGWPMTIDAEIRGVFSESSENRDNNPPGFNALILKPYATGLLTCAINYLNLIEELNQCVTTINDCKDQLRNENQPVTEKTIIEKLSQTGLAQQNQFVHAFMLTGSSAFAGEVSKIFALKRKELNDTISLAKQRIKEHKKNPAIKLMAACVGRQSPKLAVVGEFEQKYDGMLEPWSGLPSEPAAGHKASVSSGEGVDADLPAGDKTPLLREESISVGSDDSSGGKALCGDKAQQPVLTEESVPGETIPEQAQPKKELPAHVKQLKMYFGEYFVDGEKGHYQRMSGKMAAIKKAYEKSQGLTVSTPFCACAADNTSTAETTTGPYTTPQLVN